MFPGMNPRDVEKAMKRLGITQEEIEAELVIIKTAEKDLIIKNPHVSKVNMMGQETIQVVGNIIEVDRKDEMQIKEEDIQTIIAQTNCTREQALNALEVSDGNLAIAILKLQNK